MAMTQDVIEVFRAIHIETADAEDRLCHDLGMDSQELVSLACELERHFGVPVHESDVHSGMTVADVVTLMAGKLTARPSGQTSTPRQGSLVEQIVVHAPWAEVYDGLLHVEAWPSLLPHIDRIDVVYDDGRYQEFWMTVRSTDGSTIRVRSIRRCGDREILFFQPEPPRYLARHSGGWKFEPVGDRQSIVTTYHEWVLNDRVDDVFPATTDETTEAQVARVLRDHARLALGSWKSIIEGRHTNDSGTDTDRCPVAARV
jgi:acyl carrier protein